MAPILSRTTKRAPRSSDAPPGEAEPRLGAGELAARLRNQMADHDIPPGARLREWDLATEYGVPRLVARDALDRLIQLGFADRQPNRGVVAHRFGIEELLRLYDMREVNEGLCARLAAHNARAEIWDDLIETFGDKMADIVERKDFDAYSTQYERLRARLITVADSPPLAALLERLNDMTRIVGRRMLLVSDRATHALNDHRAVLTALRAGDPCAAEQLRRATIRNVKEAVWRYHAFLL
jgi:DNA-binding GntR family transcriptional regulator